MQTAEILPNNQFEAPQPNVQVYNYDWKFDQRDYISLFREADKYTPWAFSEVVRRKNEYTLRQLDTELGERYHVNLSTTFYDVRDGALFGEGIDIPFLEIMKRGRDYRRKYGNSSDFAREAAEVIGFEKMEKILLDPNTPEGTMVVSISPPGVSGKTIYSHNFYDVGYRNPEGKIEFRRYSSALPVREYSLKAKVLDFNSRFTPDSKDFEFLAEPLIIKPNALFRNPDDVHAFLHTDHEFMSLENFNALKTESGMTMAKIRYIEGLIQVPYSSETHVHNLKAIWNRGDYLRRVLEGESIQDSFMDIQNIHMWGDREPEMLAAGCGTSGTTRSSKSVSEFGMRDAMGELSFNCPKCGGENIRPYGGYVANCQNCGTDQVACKPEKN